MMFVAAHARADDVVVATAPPPEAKPTAEATIPPWILRRASVRFDATLELEMSKDNVAKPVSIAPDLWYGVSDDVTVGITDSRFAATGFRGSAGGAFCVTGTTRGCPRLYNNVGAEAWAALARGTVSLVAGGGPYATDLHRGFYSFKLGVKSRLTAGRISLTTTPAVLIAMTKRDASPTPNTDALYVPVALGVRLVSSTTIALGSGIKGPVSDFRHHWSVPLGIVASSAIGRVQFGASWVFGTLVSAAENPPAPQPPVEGMDLRVVQGWISCSWGGTPNRARPAVAVVATPSPTAKPAPSTVELPPPVENPPEVGPPRGGDEANAELAGAAIAAVAADHAHDVAACVGASELHGEVAIDFEINKDGKVVKTAMSSTIGNGVIADCLLHELRSWQFPKPPSGAARGSYAFTYR